jgi:Protein of unknown function (DUF4089)
MNPEIAALVHAEAAAIGLRLSPEHWPGTVQNMELIATMAKVVMSFSLPPQIEPAPVFSHDKS